jgi:hypothetical protein
MTKKEELVWRLGKLPTPEEVQGLVKDKIITTDEAREILFSTRTIEDRDKSSLEAEIKFLRGLVETLSTDKSQIIKYITIQEPKWNLQPFYEPYKLWCGSINSNLNNTVNCLFGDIQTF